MADDDDDDGEEEKQLIDLLCSAAGKKVMTLTCVESNHSLGDIPIGTSFNLWHKTS